ncbi:phosphopantetheine-binding protein [Spirosoma soli]|uniref:Phosphopantetheine-binding protein n=1 Tax=Spirosoma soli TaxID=1770529 RepID=A0ABW5M6N3_9BACT
MISLIQYDRLRTVILRQGIVTMPHIHPEANLRKDLGYKAGDLRELARLIEDEFHLKLTAEQIKEISTIRSIVGLLNQVQLVSTPVEGLH